MKSLWQIMVACASLFFIPGCHITLAPWVYKSYSGKDKPRTEVAYIIMRPPVYLDTVDGKTMQVRNMALTDISRVELLPGRHTVSVLYSTYAGSYQTGTIKPVIIRRSVPLPLDFVAEAGHVYQIGYDRDAIEQESFQPYIRDRTSGKRVTTKSSEFIESKLRMHKELQEMKVNAIKREPVNLMRTNRNEKAETEMEH